MIASNYSQRLAGYIEAIESGDIGACELIKAAVARHRADMAKQNTPEFPYYFSETVAEGAIDFFEKLLRHSIGEFAGQPLLLEPWQVFIVSLLFGWRRSDDNTRRFRSLYFSVGRKNGKSTFAAGLALLLAGYEVNPKVGKPEPVAEVLLGAPKKEQSAKIIFAELLRMRAQSPEIESHTTFVRDELRFGRNQGHIRCVGTDRPLSGANPHAVILDEIHEFTHFHKGFLDTMTTGSGSRAMPLNVYTTTAGTDASYLWLKEYNFACGVVRGDFRDESYLAICYEIDEGDNALDPTAWIKANPNLGVSLRKEYLETQAAKARSSPSELLKFKRYHGNRLVSHNSKAVDVAHWDACAGTLSNWSEADAIGAGVDLGGRDDLAAFALVARFPIEGMEKEVEPGVFEPLYRYEVRASAFIGSDTARDLTVPPFVDFCHYNHIQKCQFPQLELKAALICECHDYYVSQIAYDPSGGQDLGESLAMEGFKVGAMGQNARQFSEPIGELQELLKQQRFVHDGNPFLRWCVGNAVTVTTRNGHIMFDKSKSAEKIDPLVAMVMALRMAMLAPARPTGNYYLS